MDKDEMIEEMAKVLCDKDKRCEECISRLLLPCGYKSYCTKLYNAGYRKVADDDDEIVESMKTYERARQETAREILQDIMTKISSFEVAGLTIKSVDINIEFVKNLAKKYGIELED